VSSESIAMHFGQLHEKCGKILENSMAGSNMELVARSHQFASELESWCKILNKRTEVELLKVATIEYTFALLALTQGHYRHSFKALRLVLELTLQAVLLSTNEICLREWIDNRIDTLWSSIVCEENGVFSTRFTKAFFPDLIIHVQHYRGMATSIYRECSECVHGNIPKHVPLPSSLEFNQEAFKLWHSKADIVAMILHFVLSLRYLRDLSENEILDIEPFLTDRLGHLEEIRQLLGGPTKG
jgi:hypothetical protein